MANYIWLFLVAGGAALLGLALAFGSVKQEGKRSVKAIAGAFGVAVVALLFGIYVSSAPTAPTRPPDPQGTQYDTPARPSDQNALPGTGQPNR